jgi:hypothetical protein
LGLLIAIGVNEICTLKEDTECESGLNEFTDHEILLLYERNFHLDNSTVSHHPPTHLPEPVFNSHTTPMIYSSISRYLRGRVRQIKSLFSAKYCDDCVWLQHPAKCTSSSVELLKAGSSILTLVVVVLMVWQASSPRLLPSHLLSFICYLTDNSPTCIVM